MPRVLAGWVDHALIQARFFCHSVDFLAAQWLVLKPAGRMPEASFPRQGSTNIIMALLLVLTDTCKLRKSL